jgi:hypothetical protein
MCDICVRIMLDKEVEEEIGLIGRSSCQQVVRLCEEINQLRERIENIESLAGGHIQQKSNV